MFDSVTHLDCRNANYWLHCELYFTFPFKHTHTRERENERNILTSMFCRPQKPNAMKKNTHNTTAKRTDRMIIMRMKSNAYNLCLLRFGRESAKTNEQETIHSKEENRRIEINEEKHNRETRLQFRIFVFQREV